MSATNYSLVPQVRFADLFDGRLERFGVREHVHADTDETCRGLTDGNSYVWFGQNNDGNVGSIMWHAPGGSPTKIFAAVEEAFGCTIYSEHQPQFWGFDTDEEWERDWEARGREDEIELYGEIRKFLQGKETRLRPGTVGMLQAKIAKQLVDDNPDLGHPDKRDELLAAINEVYDRDHVLRVRMSKDLVEMLATHEDDLPKT